MADQEEHAETMGDQEENSNINITKNYTYNVHSQNVQIGEDNKLYSCNEQADRLETVEHEVEQLKLTVAALAEQLKVNDRIFKKLPANQQINSQRLEKNCSITLTVLYGLSGKVGELQVNKNITVRELEVKLQQKFRCDGVIMIYSNIDGGGVVVYNDVTVDGDSTRTLSSLGVEDGYVVCYGGGNTT